MKLHELPRNSGVKIYGLKDQDDKDIVIIFGHIDGMYSYCWLEGDESQHCHLAANTDLKKHKDGYIVV